MNRSVSLTVAISAEQTASTATYEDVSLQNEDHLAGWEDLTAVVFASDTEDDLSILALASNLEQEQEP